MPSPRKWHPLRQWRQRAASICDHDLRATVLALQPHMEALSNLDGVLRLHESMAAEPSTPAVCSEALQYAEQADRIAVEWQQTAFLCTHCAAMCSWTHAHICPGCLSAAYCSARCRRLDWAEHAAECADEKARVRHLVTELYRSGEYPFTRIIVRCGQQEDPMNVVVPTSFAVANPWHPATWTSKLEQPKLRDLAVCAPHLVVGTLVRRDAEYALGHRLGDDASPSPPTKLPTKSIWPRAKKR